MQQTGLITGASSGIGRALAHEHAKRGRDLVVVARREDELNELAAELKNKYGVEVRVIAQDLIEEGACQNIYDRLKSEGTQVDYLFNNAGFGGYGKFVERELEKDLSMIDLNIKSLVKLSHLFLEDMTARRRGWVLNTSSTAGFMPGPLQATYFATKAFVNSFSQALAEEVGDTGVVVTALCPGAVATEFAQEADLDGAEMFKNAATPESTARKGYEALEAGELKVISDTKLKWLIRLGLPLMPMRTKLKMIRKMQEQEGK